MKKITLLGILLAACCISSCKKDRVCECTETYTSPSGNVTTNPMANVTYRDVTHAEAKNLCEKATYVDVNESGGTSTDVYDCKLK